MTKPPPRRRPGKRERAARRLLEERLATENIQRLKEAKDAPQTSR